MLTKALHLKPGPCGTTPCTLCAGELSITTNLRARGGATGLLLAAPEIEIIAHHAVLTDLEPEHQLHLLGRARRLRASSTAAFTTAPRGRAALRFTSFGDQATPETGNGLASPWAAYNPPQVEAMQPLFHLLNGDLCYANISPDRAKTWRDFFLQNEVSARYRPWMPAAGNHENEIGNGQLGWRAYQTQLLAARPRRVESRASAACGTRSRPAVCGSSR